MTDQLAPRGEVILERDAEVLSGHVLAGFGLRMRRIDAPALVLWGTRDRFLGRELAQPSAALVPNCQVEYFDAGGHWLQHDCPEQVARALLAFLQPVH